jgi:hypothetical protein
VLLLPQIAMSQPPARVAGQDARICDMSARALTVSLRDARSGALLQDARVTTWRVGATAPFRTAAPVSAGDSRWIIVVDGDLPLPSAADSTEIFVRVERPGRSTVDQRLHVGRDARNCHLTLLGSAREFLL